MQRRGYKVSHTDTVELEKGIDVKLFKDYTASNEAILINKQRILERTPKGK